VQPHDEDQAELGRVVRDSLIRGEGREGGGREAGGRVEETLNV
jgi:hypothetical protein